MHDESSGSGCAKWTQARNRSLKHQWSSTGVRTRARRLRQSNCYYTGERLHHLRGVYLIHDGDPSHTARLTQEYLRSCRGWWRSRFTPVHASWLDQAEILNNAFGYHYLRRGSWRNQEEFIAHIVASWLEYNQLYAHPFEWTWTNQKMRRWFAEHTR